MCKKLIYLMTFVLALGSTAHAALYVWNGSAGDGNWDTPANWTVTDSLWTWPNEQYGNRQVNSDTIAIDILNGDAVTRGSQLGIDGAADGSTTGVLTLNNGSSLTVGDDLATSTDPGRRGQIDILGGSTVTVVGDGNDIRIADDPDTWGMLNIVDSTVNISDDLRIDQGEGYVNISGSSTLNCDDLIVADADTGVSYLDISGTTTVTIVDDFKIDQGIGTITIGGDAVINFGDDCYIPDQSGQGTMTLTGNSVFNVGDDMTIADDADTVGHVIVTGNATLNAPDELYLADANTAFATLDVTGNATVNVGDDLNIGSDGPGICNIGENATVTVADKIYVAENNEFGPFESHMTISGNAMVEVAADFIVVDANGLTGYLHISGNPTITANRFYMNDDDGDPSYSQVIMDGGTVTVNDYCTFNDDNPGTAEFIMNGGSFYCANYLNLSDNLDGTAHLTMNGGEMITGNRLRLGKDGGEDTGQVRIFMNGGLLQAEELSDIKITDTMIVFSGGEFRINNASVSEAGMQQLITDGTIAPTGVYNVITDGAYTVLNAVPPNLVGWWKLDEADGTIAVDSSGHGNHGSLIGTALSWMPDDGMIDGALSFDGIAGMGDYVEISTADISVSAGTIAMWAKLAPDPQSPDTRYFCGHTTIPAWGNRIQLYMDNADTVLDLGLGDSHNRHKDIMLLATESWYHVALTWDGGAYVVYVDGEAMANGSYTGLDTLNTVADIGDDGNTDGRDEAFNGLLDDVRIYDIALSDAEIKALATPATGVNITWVTATRDNDMDGVQDDQAFVDWLAAEGHTVDVRIDYWGELDLEPNKVDELNAADLVIVSRSTSSGDHDDGDEPTLWNSVTTPIILMNGYLVRSSRWLWMDTTTIVKGDDILLALDPTHPLFDGVTLEMGNMVIFRDNTVGMGITSFVGSIDVGNGTLIAQTLSAENTWIAEWAAGVEFYAGSGQIAGGPRMLFVAGTQEVNADPQGAWDLTADGEQMLRNAINYMLPAAPAGYLYDGDVALYTPEGPGSLDGTWDHENGSDQWDGTGPGEGNPGGAVALTEGDVTFLRIQDTGDPRDYGMGDPGSNRKVYLTHLTDGGLDGATLEFRIRVATSAPLDDMHPDGGAGIEPWPAGGIGYHIRDDGKGMIGIGEPDMEPISFSLAKAGEPMFEDVATDVLVMNNLVGDTPSDFVDTEDAAAAVAVNMVAVDDVTQWHTFTIDIAAGGAGTHIVTVSVDGGPAESFEVTAGIGGDVAGNYIAIGSSGTGGVTAFDLDYISVQ